MIEMVSKVDIRLLPLIPNINCNSPVCFFMERWSMVHKILIEIPCLWSCGFWCQRWTEKLTKSHNEYVMTVFDNSTLGCKISNLLLQFMNFAMRYNFTTQSFTVRAVSKGGYIRFNKCTQCFQRSLTKTFHFYIKIVWDQWWSLDDKNENNAANQK